ncbi:invasion associated locus B family protein [Methyloligella halotolerans]|uniref:invasion associated locus B family protein n=1 Tax=Methyloligella halotolerans TaxID=1177755 RepID=UPI001FD89721|nr:invasion associated locus B family protein [Methyloligella halotolerans]
MDDKDQLGEPVGFTTCVEAGCVAPVTLDAGQIAKLSSAETLSINAENGSSSEPVKLTISLKGFDEARKRSAELME